MSDREQIRRDATFLAGYLAEPEYTIRFPEFGSCVLALLDTLEQAERERDEASGLAEVRECKRRLECHMRGLLSDRADSLEARLAAVPALVEAVKRAVGEAAIALEPLRAEDARKPYRELSPSMREQIITATDALRDAADALAAYQETTK